MDRVLRMPDSAAEAAPKASPEAGAGLWYAGDPNLDITR
jgi:hypothetical protein